MKKFMLLVVMLASTAVLADRGETKSFLFDGSRTLEDVVLNGAVTHPETRTERVQDTCTRRIQVGSERRCHTVNERRCTSSGSRRVCSTSRGRKVCRTENGRRICRTYPGQRTCRNVPGPRTCRNYPRRVCRTYPRYRTESYTCYRNVTRTIQVTDYRVEAHVNFEMGAIPAGVNAAETFKVSLSGDKASLGVDGSKRLLVYAEKTRENLSGEGMDRRLDVSYRVSFVDLQKALGPVTRQITGMSYNNGFLEMTTGDFEKDPSVRIHLDAERERFLGDKELFDRVLEADEYEVNSLGDGTAVIRIDVANMMDLKSGKKHHFKIKMKKHFNTSGVLNTQDLPSLERRKEIKVKIN